MNILFVYSQIEDQYEFSIKQGTKEWKQFDTIEKRIAALQIPDSILVNISTEGLLETCLNFPYLSDILFFDNYQLGFEALVKEFNGFRELLQRHNLTNVLLEKYSRLSVNISNLRLANDIDQGKFTFRYFVLEFMFAQNIVLQNLSEEQEKRLFLLSFEHKKIKQNYPDIFSNLNDIPVSLLYAKKIINDSDFKFESAEQKKYLLNFIQAPVTIDQRIIGYVEDYVNIKYK
jgi:hypothetical protein